MQFILLIREIKKKLSGVVSCIVDTDPKGNNHPYMVGFIEIGKYSEQEQKTWSGFIYGVKICAQEPLLAWGG